MSRIVKDGFADVSNTLSNKDSWFGNDFFTDEDTSQPYVLSVPESGVIGGLPSVGPTAIGFDGEMYSITGWIQEK